MKTTELSAEPRLESYGVHWLLLIAATLALAGSFWMRWNRPPVPPASALTVQGQSSFFVIHMPHAESLEDERYLGRLTSWLDALEAEHFQVLALSEVMFRLRRNIALPDGAVVLVYDEALRDTLSKARPLLEQRRVPTVIVTHREPIDQADFGYISAHELSLMNKSGLWDIGYYAAGDEGVVRFQSPERPGIVVGRQGAASIWRLDGDGRLLNQGSDGFSFKRLFLPLEWNGSDLTQRLLAEAPAPKNALLSLRKIDDHPWGVVRHAQAGENERFSLSAPAQSRSGSVLWLGTERLRDFELSLDVRRRVGELWLLLRSDRKTGECLRLGFLDARLVLLHEKAGQQVQIAEAEWLEGEIQRSLHARVKLEGRRLEVSDGHGKILLSTSDLPASVPQSAVIQMLVYDPVRGSALAGDTMIQLTHSGFSL